MNITIVWLYHLLAVRKLCKNGCAKDKCNNPGMARIPLEATGVNVIKSLANIGIKIEFPLIDKFYRFGLIAW